MADYAWRNETDDLVYLQVGADIHVLGEGDAPLEWSYLSPYIGGTELLQRVYREVGVASDGNTRLKVLCEDRPGLTVALPPGRQRVKLPLNFVARWVQLELSGKGRLSELAVTYGGD